MGQWSCFSWILGQFQHCCWCGAPLWCRQILCDFCQNEVFRSQRPETTELGAPNLNWGQQDLLSLGSYSDLRMAFWIRGLKGPLWKNDFSHIGRELLKRRILRSPLKSKAVYLVVPPSSRFPVDKNHAFFLARSISETMRWPLLYDWAPNDGQKRPQKSLKREERFHRSLKYKGFVGQNSDCFVFIDDVVTTGSTAEAVWVALGRPPHFEVWCIAHQPKLVPLPGA